MIAEGGSSSGVPTVRPTATGVAGGRSPSWRRRLLVPWMIFVVVFGAIAVAAKLKGDVRGPVEPAP